MNTKGLSVMKILVFLIPAFAMWSFSTHRESRWKNDFPDRLPGTELLTWEGDLSSKMMDGANVFIEKKIDASVVGRKRFWHRDFSSREAYEKSIEPNRKRFRKYIGVVDQRTPPVMQRIGENDNPEKVAETGKYSVYQVRWSVLQNVYGEGLMLVPKGKTAGYVVAVPDADQTPEQITGLAGGINPEAQYARRLAENGFQVIVPVLINRSCSAWFNQGYSIICPTIRRQICYEIVSGCAKGSTPWF